jgi:hypothetical protein
MGIVEWSAGHQRRRPGVGRQASRAAPGWFVAAPHVFAVDEASTIVRSTLALAICHTAGRRAEDLLLARGDARHSLKKAPGRYRYPPGRFIDPGLSGLPRRPKRGCVWPFSGEDLFRLDDRDGRNPKAAPR